MTARKTRLLVERVGLGILSTQPRNDLLNSAESNAAAEHFFKSPGEPLKDGGEHRKIDFVGLRPIRIPHPACKI